MASGTDRDESGIKTTAAEPVAKREESSKRRNGFQEALMFFRRHWILIGIVAIAALLRFWALGKDSLWVDEVFSVNIANGGLLDILRASSLRDPQNLYPPLYHLILHFWMLVFGQSEPALRSLSAVFGTITILVMYKVGSELFNRNTGLVASFLLTISPFAIYYSQEVRPYSLLMLLTLVSFLFFTRMLKPGPQRRADLLVYCSVNVLLVYTHPYALFVVGSEVLYLLIFRKRYASATRPFWIAQAVTALVTLPWMYFLVTGIGAATETIARVTGPTILVPAGLLTDIWGFWAGDAAVLLGLFCTVLFGAGLFRLSKKEAKILVAKPRTALLLVWIVVPLAGAVTVALMFQSLFFPKYVIAIVPAVYLVIARGTANLTDTVKSYLARVNVKYILLALVLLLCLPQIESICTDPMREQWREVADLVQQESQSHDVILSYARYDIPFNYYYQGDLEIVGYGAQEGEELAALVDRATEGKERLWLIMMQYTPAIDAPIRGYLLACYGGDSVAIQQDFQYITVYLFRL